MIPPWWGVPVILILGIGAVWFGWWFDRRRHQHAQDALREPPGRSVPGLDASLRPTYTTMDDLVGLRAPEGDPGLLERRGEAPTLPGGTHPVFLEDAAAPFAAVAEPLVLVTSDDVASHHELVPILRHVRAASRSLVLVAPSIAPDAVGTLRANSLTGRIPSLTITLPDPRDLRRAVALSGGRLVDADDLRSGFLPDEAWGTCSGWISDEHDSWVVLVP